MSEEKQPPIKSYHSSGIEVSIWPNEFQNKNNETVIRHSVKLEKQYKNDKGEWIKTDYFFPDEIPRVQSMLQKAFDYITIKESSDDVPV